MLTTSIPLATFIDIAAAPAVAAQLITVVTFALESAARVPAAADAVAVVVVAFVDVFTVNAVRPETEAGLTVTTVRPGAVDAELVAGMGTLRDALIDVDAVAVVLGVHVPAVVTHAVVAAFVVVADVCTAALPAQTFVHVVTAFSVIVQLIPSLACTAVTPLSVLTELLAAVLGNLALVQVGARLAVGVV